MIVSIVKTTKSALLLGILAACISGCSTLTDAKGAKGTGESQTYAANSNRVWEVLPKATKDLGLEYIAENKTEGYALAQRGISFVSYGEHVAIFVVPLAEQSTKVEVVSKKALATNIFAPDWAKPLLEKIAELIK